MDDVYKTTDKYNRFTEAGKEMLNPTPMQPPLGYERPLSMVEVVRQQIRQFKHLEDTEPETEEEADDFEIAEDPIMESRWENDMIPSIKESRERLAELEREANLYANPNPSPREAAEPPPSPEPPLSDVPPG